MDKNNRDNIEEIAARAILTINGNAMEMDGIELTVNMSAKHIICMMVNRWTRCVTT